MRGERCMHVCERGMKCAVVSGEKAGGGDRHNRSYNLF